MQRLTTLFILGILWHFQTFAQSFNGYVKDKDDTAMEWATVILKNVEGKPVAYTHSDQKGYFEVDVQPGKNPAELSIGMMGYETLKLPVNEFKNGRTYKMYETSYELKEVKVKAQKIRQTGDTLIYSVNAFRQKQDRSIADVIAKIPGLQIGADGKISYEGRNINTYYIEGMDLLGGKYSIANENISADKVKSVEVLQNHQPVKALKGIKFSEQAAINIVLRDDSKNIWQGIADVGTGLTLQHKTKWLRELRLMGMFISPKMQSISLLKTDNTGKDIEHEVSDLTPNRSLTLGNGLLSGIDINRPALAGRRYRLNDTYIIASNWLIKTGKNNDLRFQLNGLTDKTEQQSRNEKIYLDAESGNALITEEQNAFTKRNEWKGELLYKVNKEKIYLANSLKGYIDFDYARGNTLLNGISVHQEVTPRARYIADDLEYITNMKGNRSFSVSSQFIYGYQPGRLLLRNGITERLGLHTVKWNTYSYFRHKTAGFNVTYKVGVDFQNKHLNTANDLTDRRDCYTELLPYVSPVLAYQDKNMKLTLSGRLGWMYRKLNSLSKSTFTAEPSLYFKYDFSSKINTTLTYSMATIANSMDELSLSPIYINYMTLTKGKGKPEDVTVHTFRNSWSYRDAISGFFTSMGFTANVIRNIALYAATLDKGFYKREVTNEHGKRESCVINGSLGKSIGWGKFSVSAKALYGWDKYQLMLGGQLTDLKMQRGSLGIETSYHPIDFFSVEERSSMNYMRQDDKLAGNDKSSLRYFHHELKFFIMPGNWQIEWDNELYHSNDKTVNTNFFSDLSINYRTKTYEVSLSCNNLFGANRYERRYVTTNERIFSINNLRERSLTAKVSFNL